MEKAIWKAHKWLALFTVGAFLAGGVVAWVLIGAAPGSKADWVAAAGTWVIGYGAISLAWRAGQREEIEQREAREEARKEEFASLFSVLSVARRSVECTENILGYFENKDGLGHPREATLWALGRLVGRIDEIRGRELALSVLPEPDQELIFDLEEEASWLKAIALDLTDEINKDHNLNIANHYAVPVLTEGAETMRSVAKRLIESTTARRRALG